MQESSHPEVRTHRWDVELGAANLPAVLLIEAGGSHPGVAPEQTAAFLLSSRDAGFQQGFPAAGAPHFRQRSHSPELFCVPGSDFLRHFGIEQRCDPHDPASAKCAEVHGTGSVIPSENGRFAREARPEDLPSDVHRFHGGDSVDLDLRFHSLGAVAGLQDSLHVFGEQVTLQIHQIARMSLTEIGYRPGVGNDPADEAPRQDLGDG